LSGFDGALVLPLAVVSIIVVIGVSSGCWFILGGELQKNRLQKEKKDCLLIYFVSCRILI